MGGNSQPRMHAKTDDAIPSSVVMHVHVCLWSVGTDWNVFSWFTQDYLSSYRGMTVLYSYNNCVLGLIIV